MLELVVEMAKIHWGDSSLGGGGGVRLIMVILN